MVAKDLRKFCGEGHLLMPGNLLSIWRNAIMLILTERNVAALDFEKGK